MSDLLREGGSRQCRCEGSGFKRVIAIADSILLLPNVELLYLRAFDLSVR